PGSRVLDVTAGTGLDALHLAARGVDVTACDLSAGMLARLTSKAPSIPAVVADVNRLEEAGLDGPFDGLISTFAGLNAAADLAGLARAAARLVRPGASSSCTSSIRGGRGGRSPCASPASRCRTACG